MLICNVPFVVRARSNPNTEIHLSRLARVRIVVSITEKNKSDAAIVGNAVMVNHGAKGFNTSVERNLVVKKLRFDVMLPGVIQHSLCVDYPTEVQDWRPQVSILLWNEIVRNKFQWLLSVSFGAVLGLPNIVNRK